MTDEKIRVEVTEELPVGSKTYAAESLNPRDAIDAVMETIRAHDELEQELIDDE